MGKKQVNLDKDFNNPDMFPVHYVLKNQSLLSKNTPPIFNDVQKSIIKCIDVTRANADCEHLFNFFER